VNLVGPQLVERSEGFFNVGKLVILLFFIVAGLASSDQTFARLGPSSWVSPLDILGSGMLIFLSYEGFELIANASTASATRRARCRSPSTEHRPRFRSTC
jgi:amino acid transporter